MKNCCQCNIVVVCHRITELGKYVVLLQREISSWNGEVVDCVISGLHGVGKKIVGDKEPEFIFYDRASQVEIGVIVGEFVRFTHNRELAHPFRLEVFVHKNEGEFPRIFIAAAFGHHIDDTAVGRAEFRTEWIGDHLNFIERIIVDVHTGIFYPHTAYGQAVNNPVVALFPFSSKAGLSLSGVSPASISPDTRYTGDEFNGIYDSAVLDGHFVQIIACDVVAGVCRSDIYQRRWGCDDNLLFDF